MKADEEMRIAVQPDNQLGGKDDSWYSEIWLRELRARGIAADEVDLRTMSPRDLIRQYHGFMWRPEYVPRDKIMARRFIPLLDQLMPGRAYPDWRTYWQYDDKVAEALTCEALGIPSPKTWVFWTYEEAVEFLRSAPFPIVAKLYGGAKASNVRMINSLAEGERLCNWLFKAQLFSIQRPFLTGLSEWRRRLGSAAKALATGYGDIPETWWENHKGYVLFQEYVRGNSYDTRVTVVGDTAWACRRANREGDFRASGSGRLEFTYESIDERFVGLAFEYAGALGMQSVGFDFMYRGDEPIVVEFSYAFGWVSSAQWPAWHRENGRVVRVEPGGHPAIEIMNCLLRQISRGG